MHGVPTLLSVGRDDNISEQLMAMYTKVNSC